MEGQRIIKEKQVISEGKEFDVLEEQQKIAE